ncbi:hypothetical protein V2P20_11755 [Methylobacter sp. Wu1]|uniref:hypothetical protein n=1 Tax=Methylobacter sp. Wu1 TaxID=3119359 RepID=UPI002F924B31
MVGKLRKNNYLVLRRGIIEGCRHIVKLIEENKLTKDDLRFNHFISETEKKVSIDDLQDYIKVLEKFLPLRAPSNNSSLYKLFIRTLAHEWEAAEPKQLNKQNKQNGAYAFSWIMKMSRNWLAHGKVFEQLNPQDVAYLFIVNMRAMFDLGDKLLPYESHLLRLFTNVLREDEMKARIGDPPHKKNTENYNQRKIPLVENYAALLMKYNSHARQAINFHDALNNLQKNNDNASDSDFFIKGLYQTFWFLTSIGEVYIPQDEEQIRKFHCLNYQFKYFDYQKDYLFELARHIYNSSF